MSILGTLNSLNSLISLNSFLLALKIYNSYHTILHFAF